MADVSLKIGLDRAELDRELDQLESDTERRFQRATQRTVRDGGGNHRSAFERESEAALRLAQAQARLQQVTGNLTGAQTTLERALHGVNQEGLAALRVQTQLAGVHNRLQREVEGGATAFIRFGYSAQGSSRIAREGFITAASEIIESWGVDGDIANEFGLMLYNLPIQAKLAIAGVAGAFVVGGAAVAAVVVATNEMLDVAKKVGTTSKDDFDEFTKSIRAAGGEVTTLDRKLSQELIRSADQVKAATDNLFLVLLRESGPELLVLLQSTSDFLREMTPVAQRFGGVLSEAFNIATAAMRTFSQGRQLFAAALTNPTQLFGLSASIGVDLFRSNLAAVRQEAEAAQEKVEQVKLKGFKGLNSDPSELKQLADQLKNINDELAIFRDTTSAEYKLRIRIDEREELKAQIEEIIKLRRELGQDPQTAFATTFDARGREVLDPAGIKTQLEFLRRLKREAEETAKGIERIGERLAKNNEGKLTPTFPAGFREELVAVAKLADILNASQTRLNLGTTEAKVVTSEYYQSLLNLNTATSRAAAEEARLQAQRNDSVEALRELTESLNKELLDYNSLSREQQTLLTLQGEAYQALTEAERQNVIELARNVDAVEENRRAMEEFARTTEGLFNTLFDRGPKAFFDELLDIGKRTLAKLLAEFTAFGQGANQTTGTGISGFLRNLFGLGGGGNTATGGGSGNFFSNLLGGGGNLFRTPSFNPAATGALPNASRDFSSFLETASNGGVRVPDSITQGQTARAVGTLPTLANGSVSNASVGGFLGRFLGGGAISLAPALLGLSLGAGLGGESTPGRILGALGGGAVGLGLAFGASVFGAGGGLGAAALAALGPAALIGAPLLVGALLLGRARQRRDDERTSGDSLQRAIDQIKDLKQQADRGQLTSVAEAESAFTQIHRTFINETLQLKTESVRKSRIENQGDLTPPLHKDSLRLLFEREALTAVVAANRRRGVFDNLLPEFETGGVVPRTGLIFAHEREVILNLNQQRGLAALAGPDIFQRIGVPDAPTIAPAGNGALFSRGSSVSSSPQSITLLVEVGMSKTGAAEMLASAVETSTGERVIVNLVNKAKLNRQT